jgi:cell envelope opacity-associated protein A
LVIIGILLPSDDSQNPASASREANLNLQSQSQPQAGGNQAVPLPPITNTPTVSDADQMAPVAPEPIQDEQPDQAQPQQPAASSPINPHHRSAPGIEQQWRTYRIESGKTLPSCSAIMGCRPPTLWRRLKALVNRKHVAERTDGADSAERQRRGHRAHY